MYPELVTRPDIKVFLPPIGGMTVYICTSSFPTDCHRHHFDVYCTLQLGPHHIFLMKAKCSHYVCTMNVGHFSSLIGAYVLTLCLSGNGSDVFGSDICTCKPYLVFAIEECIRTAQRGGVGVVVYFRKEGRALGEVTKYLVYNLRKRGGDSADKYFRATELIAGVKDMRFQALMPDVLHWLGIKKVDNMISMSDMYVVMIPHTSCFYF
jgi:hypothetical protein